MKYIVKNYSDRILLARLYIVKVILNNPKIILYNIAFSRGKAPNNPVMNYTRVQYFLFFFIYHVI